MVRRRRRGPGRRRGIRRSNPSNSRGTFRLTIPYFQIIAEGKTTEFSFNSILQSSPQAKFLSGIPWRLISVRYQFSATAFNISGGVERFTGEPAVVQVGLDSGQNSNIENMVIQQFLVNQVPIQRTIFMRSPNPWKEDEQRAQSLFTISNLHQPGSTVVNSTLYALIWFNFSFGNIPFDITPPKIHHTEYSSDDSNASSPVRLNLEDL